jgi:hypothetical protein
MPRKNFVLSIESWIFKKKFQFFFLLMVLNDFIFNMSAPIWMRILWFLLKKFYKFHMLEFSVKTPSSKRIWAQSYLQIQGWNSSTCIQFDLEVMCTRSKQEKRLPNFHEFWGEEVHYIERASKKKILMFEHYNLVDPIEQGAVIDKAIQF